MTHADPRLAEFAEQFDFSQAAVQHLWDAVAAGGGDMAMFDHPELAGPGQWMRGGLIMISAPANYVLKNRIEALCNALSDALREDSGTLLTSTPRAWDVVSVARGHWWPPGLGEPSATGSQNDMGYAYFDKACRLAIRVDGDVAVYDTGSHRMTGASQSQQHAHSRLSFTSQLGDVSLDDLERVDIDVGRQAEPLDTPQAGAQSPSANQNDILDAIERLAALKDKDILTDEEFDAKKADLLERL